MDYDKLILIFAGIIYEALPFIVLGVVLAGILEEFVPQQMIARFIPSGRAMHVGAVGLGAVLGLVFPMCECGIIPVMRRLLRKGVPLSVCTSYLLAGPIINVVVLTSTAVAFQADPAFGGMAGWVLWRAGLAFVIAVTTGLIVERQLHKHGREALLAPIVVRDVARHEAHADAPPQRQPFLRRLGNITETALHDFVDIMAFLVLGALIASVARILVPQIGAERLLQDYPLMSIPIMMAFAVIFCLCSEADAFVAANFQPVGLWPPASKVAFLVLGPMLDIKLLMMYTRIFRPRLIATIVTAVVLQVLAWSLLVYYFGETIAETLIDVFPTTGG